MKQSATYYAKALFYTFMSAVFIVLLFYAMTGNFVRAFVMMILLLLIGHTMNRSQENSRLAMRLDVEDKMKDKEQNQNDRTA